MPKIQEKTFNYLSELELKGVKELRIKIKQRDGFYSDDFNMQKPVALKNGIHFEMVSSFDESGMFVTLNNGDIFNVSKWYSHDNFKFLQDLFEEDSEIPREIDVKVFNIVSDIFDGLLNLQNEMAKDFHKELESSSLVKMLQPNNEDVLLVGRTIKDYSTNSHTFNFHNLTRNSHTSSDFIKVLCYEEDSERNSNHHYNTKRDFSALLNNMIRPIELKVLPVEEATFGPKDILSEKNDYILFNTLKVEHGQRFDGMVNVEHLEGYDFDLGVCDFTNQNIITSMSSSSVREAFASDMLGASRSFNDRFYMSRAFFDNLKTVDSCVMCGESNTFILKQDIKDALRDDMDLQEVLDFMVRFTVIKETYESNIVCSYCSSKLENYEDFLEKYDGEFLNGSVYKDRFTEFCIEDNPIESWNYEPEIEMFATGEEEEEERNLFMGCEIEIDKGGYDDNFAAGMISQIISNKGFIYNMSDGSLNNGFEMATMPGTLDYHMSNHVDYARGFELASDLGYRSHDTSTCGLHVHINRDFFGRARATQNIKAAFLTLIMEKNWDKIVEFSRRDYHSLEEWARKKDLEFDVVKDEADESVVRKFMDKYDHEKYVALNVRHPNTFEIRIFRGTIKTQSYLATLQFTRNLARIAKDCTRLSQAQQITFEDIVEYESFEELDAYIEERNLL